MVFYLSKSHFLNFSLISLYFAVSMQLKWNTTSSLQANISIRDRYEYNFQFWHTSCALGTCLFCEVIHIQLVLQSVFKMNILRRKKFLKFLEQKNCFHFSSWSYRQNLFTMNRVLGTFCRILSLPAYLFTRLPFLQFLVSQSRTYISLMKYQRFLHFFECETSATWRMHTLIRMFSKIFYLVISVRQNWQKQFWSFNGVDCL